MIKRKYEAIQWTDDADYRIPSELLQWLNRDSYSFLVKGAPGTGKTTLALTMLKALNPQQNFLFVSTKSSHSEIFRDHGWLSGFLRLTKEEMRDDRRLLYSHRGSFVDARLDEQSSLFETITDELMNQRSPLIIIDSWDSISEMMEPEALLANAKMLQTWCERASAKLILISSTQETKTFDSVVDGIALLRQDFLEGRRVREIVFSKLRGIETVHPSYYFTLNGGIFRSFDPYRLSDFAIDREVQMHYPVSHWLDRSRPRSISTMHRDLDIVLGGGFPVGSVAVLEIDRNVNSRVVLAVFRRMLDHLVKSGNLLLFQPPFGIDAEKVGNILGSFTHGQRKRRVEVLWTNSDDVKLDAKTLSDHETGCSPLEITSSDLRKKFPERTLVALLDLGSMRMQEGWKQDTWAKQLQEFLRRETDLSIIVTRRGEIQDDQSIEAETRLEIVDMRGTLFLDCRVPYSQYFAVSSEKKLGRSSIELEPML
ncbi:MAG: AAA family ATPase [Nitrososphaerota archaeon]|nr:AAA family ATPase [Nitrososphaerota archaeon]